jgi:hypothetical protein
MFAQAMNQQPKPTAGRIADLTTPYRSIRPPPRKKTRISVSKRETYLVEFNTSNEKFRNPKKVVWSDISDKGQHTQQFGQRCEVDSAKSPIATFIPASRTISNEEIKNRWYDRSDLKGFRQQAKQLVLFQHHHSHSEEKSLPRGMDVEALYTIRRKHKAKALRYILLAHRIGKDQDYLAWLCAKLGRWNKEIALRDAWLDYFEIYQPSFVQSVPPILSKPPNIPFVPESVAKKAARLRSKTEEPPLSSPPRKRERHCGCTDYPSNNGASF